LPFVGFVVLLAAAVGSPSPAVKASTVVAADGSGEFRSVQEAIDAVTARNRTRVVIRIKPGVYKARVTIPSNKPLLTFQGEDAATTVLTYDLNARSRDAAGREVGTGGSFSTRVSGDDFVAENITFENSSGNNGQALAIDVSGDRAIFRRCRFLGWQDTVYLGRGRHYFKDCFITGHVDFIFGGATAFFEDCRIHCRAGGYITAASTPEGQPHGFVFSNCKVTADPDRRKSYLGRPWRPFASVIFLNCQLPEEIAPEGWHNWNDPTREKTVRYAEYRSTGPGANPAARVKWSGQLKEEEARAYAMEKVLSGSDGWKPETR
jgi:pectinesterase